MLVYEGTDPWTSGRFYVAVVQYELMFGSKMWVVTFRILRAMDSLHNKAARRISGRISQRLQNIGWYYPPIGEALEDVVMERIGIYITCIQETVTQYISTWMIFDIAVSEDCRPGFPALLHWWGQAGIRFERRGEAEVEGGNLDIL